jgi:hypothetical protein
MSPDPRPEPPFPPGYRALMEAVQRFWLWWAELQERPPAELGTPAAVRAWRAHQQAMQRALSSMVARCRDDLNGRAGRGRRPGGPGT